MSHESEITGNGARPGQTGCVGLDVFCNYVLPDETLRILLTIVQEVRKSEERQQSEAA